jgi:cytoskeleton protein RodZ
VVKDATGKTLMSRLNPSGSSQALQGTPPLSVVVGNAKHVKLVWRGKPVDLVPYIKVDVAKMSLQ